MRMKFILASLLFLFAGSAGSSSARTASDDPIEVDAEAAKVELALTCGARFGAVDEVKVLLRSVDSGHVVLKGKYRQRLSIGGRFGPIDQQGGSEYSGTFVARFGRSHELIQVSWKIGLSSGNVPSRCLAQ